MASYVEKFLQTPHLPEIKSLLKNDGLLAKPVVQIFSNKLHTARPMIFGLLSIAIDAGKKWAEQFLPISKKTSVNIKIDISKLIEKTIAEIGDRVTKLLLGDKGKNIKKSTLTEHGKSIIRKNVVETYMKSALDTWKKRGVDYCKRVELDDLKTCQLCIYLNTKEYEIDYLLSLDNPLTHDTHPNCRGAFVPIINNISKIYKSYNEEPVTFNMSTKNVELQDAPIEYKPWLEQFFDRVTAPFKIIFSNDIKSDYELKSDKLIINPLALHDEDPREIITEAMAKKVPKNIVKKTIKDYKNMMELGLVIPPLYTNDDEELFKELYQQYLLNQLDDLYEVVYFKTFFDNTPYGKNKK